MKTATVEGRQVVIGDCVSFKCDIEQAGRITDIRPSRGGVTLVLENEQGFDGAYIGRDTITEIDASDCWLEGVD